MNMPYRDMLHLYIYMIGIYEYIHMYINILCTPLYTYSDPRLYVVEHGLFFGIPLQPFSGTVLITRSLCDYSQEM